MPFVAKSSPPNPAYCAYRHPTLSQAIHNRCTIYTCMPGYLDTECLLAELLEQDRQVLWLRLEPEDGDPATFILSLLQAVQVENPDLGADLIKKMRRGPGPVTGWTPLFHHLAHILTEALGENGALIFEHIHKLSPVQPTLGLVSAHLVPNLPEHYACIMISHERVPSAAFPGHAHPITEKDLRLTTKIGIHLARELELCLPDKVIKQAIHLLDGRIGALKALFAACELFGQDFLQNIIQQGHNANYILSIILSRWLATFGDEDIQNLVLCSKIEYSHPDLFTAGSDPESLAVCPWFQPLSGGWQRLRCLWEPPLRSALRNHSYVDYRVAQQLAHRLEEIGAVEQSIRLSCELSDYHTAARVIAEHADEWMDLGQWATLEGWIKQLPDSELKAWPRLLYTQGEIAAARGHIDEARRIFAISSGLFSARGDSERACQSLLAESTLAAWQGEKSRARGYAQSASALAQQAGLADPLGYASWQLAGLSAASGTLEEALTHVAQGIETLTDPSLTELFYRTAELLQNQLDLQGQCKSQYQAYHKTLQAEQRNLESLQQLMNSPTPNLPEVFARRGWSKTPLILKMPAPVQPVVYTETEMRPNFLKRLIQALSISQPVDVSSNADGFYVPIREYYSSTEGYISQQIDTVFPHSTLEPAASGPVIVSDFPAQLDQPASEVLSAYLLGPFRLSINATPLVKLPSNRGLAVLKYVLHHRSRFIARDVLMDAFWPNADPESARNSLNVAMHSLRQALRSVTSLPVIQFENGNYCLNPNLQLWIDVEEFERHIKAGQIIQGAGQITEAIREYEAAISLYQGDFLADDPYEEWTISTRDRLRLAYIDALDHLSQFYFSQEDYSASATLCQLILACDNCQEDAHCRLMRCYSRQGQRHLALRQYQVCVDALRAELDAVPESTTTILAERIRRQEAV